VSRRICSIPILVAILLPLVAATAHGTAADSLSLFVTFRTGTQRIAVTLPSGAPVGTTTGAPTVIPPGFYNLFFDDSAGVTGPEFELTGPGVNMIENMFYGEIPSATFTATFAASSTYTWRNNEQPSVVFTFATSAATGSTGSGPTVTTPTSSGSKPGTPAKSIVGSGVVPFRGKLAATVDAAGKIALTTKGKPVNSLKAGLYTFTVVDKSATRGFAIQKLKAGSITLTGVAYKGTHVATINLKAGQWTFFSPNGTKHFFIVVA
jgi:hypothetical protein